MSTTVIPVPTDDKAFERQCRVLFAELLGDPHIKLVGTKGKNQGGLDLMGTRGRDPNQPVGVQCKLVTKANGKLDLADVRSDISRALALKPPLTEVYVVTTASDDLTYDQLAMTMRQEQAALKRIVEIQIWGWDNLQEHIRQHVDAQKAFDPHHSASTDLLIDLGQESVALARQSNSRFEGLEAQLTAISVQIGQPADAGGTTALDIVFNAQLDGIRDLLNTGRPKTALGMLETLEKAPPAPLSDPIRARILANKGWAYLRMGDHKHGGELLLQAHDLNPNDPKSRANRVFGLLLLDDVDGAIAEGRTILAADPANASAASFVYQAASLFSVDVGPDDFVPSSLRSDENVTITRTVYLRRHRTDGSWRESARQGVTAFPESRILMRFDAEASLDSLYERRTFNAANTAHEDRQALEGATETLQEIWDVERQGEVPDDPIVAGLAANLITAYRALRDLDAATRVATLALERAPDSEDLLVAAAHVDILAGRSEAAVQKLARVDPSPGRAMALILALADLGKWDRLITEANAVRREDFPVLDRQAVDSMRIQALIAGGQSTDPDSDLDGLLAAWPANLPMAITVADLAGHHHKSRFEELFGKAQSLLSECVPLGERLMLADLALRHQRFEVLVRVLDGHVAIDTLTEPLVWLALGFANSPVSRRTRPFFEELPTDIVGDPRVARIAGAAAYNRGDLAAAKMHFERAIEIDPGDLRALMMLHGCLQRDARWDEAGAVIVSIDEHRVTGEPIEQMRLAGALRRAGEVDRALALAYDVASQNRDNEAVAGAYPMLFFMSEEVPPEIVETSPVRVGCWVRLQGIGTSDIEALISNRKVDGVLSVAPDQPLAKAVLGKNDGDEIQLPMVLGIEQRYKLSEVKHRYVWLLHDIMNTQKARFPESKAFIQMTMEDGNIEPVLDVVRQQDTHSKFLKESYEAGAVPLAAVAELTGSDVIGFGARIVRAGAKLRTCIGTHEERDKAQLVVRRAQGRGALIDTITLVDAWTMDLVKPMIDHFGTVSVARATLDDLVHLREKQCWDVGRESMTMGFEGDQAFRMVHSPEEKASALANLERLILFARDRLTVLPDDGEELTTPASWNVSGFGEFIQPIALAREHNLVFISEDLNLRQLAEAEAVCRHAWLQAMALEFRDQGLIDGLRYARAAAQCAAAGKEFVTVDMQTLLALLGLDENDTAFGILAARIGGPHADMRSHLAVVLEVAASIWATNIPHWRKGRAIGRLLTAVVAGLGEQTPSVIVFAEQLLRRQSVAQGRRPDLAANYIADWRQGHFLAHQSRRPGVLSRKSRGLRS